MPLGADIRAQRAVPPMKGAPVARRITPKGKKAPRKRGTPRPVKGSPLGARLGRYSTRHMEASR